MQDFWPFGSDWQAVRGNDATAALTPAAQFYFHDQWLAPAPGAAQAPLWLAAPTRLPACYLLDAETFRDAGGVRRRYRLCAPLASNRSWVDERTLFWWQQRSLTLVGEMRDDIFEVRALWPEDWRIPRKLHGTRQSLDGLIDGMDAPLAPFLAHSIWHRESPLASDWVLGLMLNGAQGDDDEAHGGHFAVVLGKWQDGDPSRWLAANFYNPDVVSEKGILPALTPLDIYLTDLNAGQQMYRPSLLFYVRLHSARVLETVWQSLQQTFEQVYDHRLHYHHARNNCTGITIDTLRGAGFNLPEKGPTARLLAPFVAAWSGLVERRFAAAKSSWEYLLTEQSRLFPVQAFRSVAGHWRALLGRGGESDLEHHFVQDAQSMGCIRLPQVPSTRALGRSPVDSVWAYQKRTPVKRSDWQVVPVPERPFPVHLRKQS